MITYGYIWMGVTLVLFLVLMYAAYARALLQTRPLVALGIALAAAYAVRVATYLQFLKLLSFEDMVSPVAMLVATSFGVLLLSAYTFLILSIVNLIFPRTLRGGDMCVLALLGGTGVSLVGVVYGIGMVIWRQLMG